MEGGYSCSDECGCEHCHRIQAAYDAQAARLAAVEQTVEHILEGEQEIEDAVCPCCNQPLLVEINMVELPKGALGIKYLKLVHQGTTAANALQAKMDRLRRR